MRPRPSNNGFRMLLRQTTRAEHDAAERAFAPFHESPLPHLAWFLNCQYTALHALARACDSATGHSADLLPMLTEALRADCTTHCTAPADLARSALPNLHPLAVDYLVLGSRLGTEVLRRRLSDATGCAALPCYFEPRDHLMPWRAACEDLDAIKTDSTLADKIVTDTRSGFELFNMAARINPLKSPKTLPNSYIKTR
ncbi:hypothetical protein [Phaeobacter porticola]|nr:hypothetical protein [Phaeobacter porticola]